jgi:hypothetical protein
MGQRPCVADVRGVSERHASSAIHFWITVGFVGRNLSLREQLERMGDARGAHRLTLATGNMPSGGDASLFRVPNLCRLAVLAAILGSGLPVSAAEELEWIRNSIEDEARVHQGSYGWIPREVPGFLTFFGVGSPRNLCNTFVADVIEGAGLARPIVNWRTPSAREWANPVVEIPGWRVVYPTAETSGMTAAQVGNLRRGGDVIATEHHVGIVTSDNWTISATTLHGVTRSPIPVEVENQVPTRDLEAWGSVQITDFGWIRPPGPTVRNPVQWEAHARTVLGRYTIRRYVGGAPGTSFRHYFRDSKEFILDVFSTPPPIQPYRDRRPAKEVLRSRGTHAAQELGAKGCLLMEPARQTSVSDPRVGTGRILACEDSPEEAFVRFVRVADVLLPRDFWWGKDKNFKYSWIEIGENGRRTERPIEHFSDLIADGFEELRATHRLREARIQQRAVHAAEIRSVRAAQERAERQRREREAEDQLRRFVIGGMRYAQTMSGGASVGPATWAGSIGGSGIAGFPGAEVCPSRYSLCMNYVLEYPVPPTSRR